MSTERAVAIQIPSQTLTGFVVPSATDISEVVEVPSSSPHDLQAARERYAMESSSSTPYFDADVASEPSRRRHGHADMRPYHGVGSYNHGSFSAPVRPSVADPQSLRGVQTNGHPHYDGQRPSLRSTSSASSHAFNDPVSAKDRAIGKSDWVAPSDWNDALPQPPPKENKEKEEKLHSLFSGMRSLLSVMSVSIRRAATNISTAEKLGKQRNTLHAAPKHPQSSVILKQGLRG